MWLRAALCLIAAAGSAAGAAGGVKVESETDCPDSASVASRIRSMLGAAAFPGHTLRISVAPAADSEPGVLRLRLTDRQGSVVGERDWPRAVDCRAAADEIGVVAATWLTALPPPPAQEALPLAAPARAPAAIAPATVAPEAVVSPPLRRRALLIGLGAGLVFTPDGQDVPLATLRVEGGLPPWPRLLWSLGVVAAGSWEHPLAEGQVSWQRWLGTFELGVRETRQRWSLSASAGIEGGAISFHGTAFSRSQSQTKPELAARATLRVAWALGRGPLTPRIWIAARSSASLLHYHARIAGADTTEAISWFQVGPLAGVDIPLPF